MIQPEAFVLLSLPNATLAAKTLIYQGILALECVTVSAPIANERFNNAHPRRLPRPALKFV